MNLAVQMQAMFKAQSQAKLRSPRYAQLLEKYDGGSPKLTSVIDARYPKYGTLRSFLTKSHPAHFKASI